MRFIQPEPKEAARDIASEAYTIHITVNDVTTVLKDRLSSRIERYFRVAVQHLIIAISFTEATTFDLVCAIRYPRAFKKQDFNNISNLESACRASANQETSAAGSCTSTQSHTRNSMIPNSSNCTDYGQKVLGRWSITVLWLLLDALQKV